MSEAFHTLVAQSSLHRSQITDKKTFFTIWFGVVLTKNLSILLDLTKSWTLTFQKSWFILMKAL